MANIEISTSAVGSSLLDLLESDDIVPGSDPSYELCKLIYLYHPLGAKMVDAPLKMAQSKPRKIAIPGSPEDRLKEAYEREWKAIGADNHIRNTSRTARMYGIASVVYGAPNVDTDAPIDQWKLSGLELYFNIADPLNTAGSLVLNQDPNSPDFQKHGAIAIAGQKYHRSRACVVMNEDPVYIAFTPSSFGFVGRSIYQRALYPLKSFIRTMVADDMIAGKLGLLIAKMKAPGSIIDRGMQQLYGIKRSSLQRGTTGQVLSIGADEEIETLNMMNVDGAGKYSRDNIITNIATACDMPAVILKNETFTQGFGEGAEDARAVAQYINQVQEDMQPLYDFFDRIVMFRAWNKDLHAQLRKEFPDMVGENYEAAFWSWVNAFHAEWPSFIEEEPSEQVKVEDTKQKAISEILKTLLPEVDPQNKAIIAQWAADNYNANKLMFPHPLDIDAEALASYEPPMPTMGGPEQE